MAVVIDAVQTRLEDFGRRIERLENTEPAVTASEVKGLKEDMAEVKQKVTAMTRALYGLALTVAGSALIVAFTAWGGTP